MSPVAGPPDWSLADLASAADAATTAVIESDFSFKAANLLKLAEALLASGHPARATDVALRAASLLGPPTDAMSIGHRAEVVEMLARLDRVSEAERLVEIDVGSRTRAALIGNLGVGRARAGNTTGALGRADAVMLVLPYDGIPAAELAVSQAHSLHVIGKALLDAGSLDLALDLARRMPDGLSRMGLLAGVALVLRMRNNADARGRALAWEVCDAARAILADLGASTALDDKASATWTTQLAAETLARWEGAEAAISFVRETVTPDRVNWTLGEVVNRLAHYQERELARSIAPEPDPADAEQLLTAADRLHRLDYDDQARTMARRAVQLVIETMPVRTASQTVDVSRMSKLRWASTLLAKLGAYEEALDAIRTIDDANRAAQCSGLASTAKQQGDVPALALVVRELVSFAKQQHVLSGMLDLVEGIADRSAVADLIELLAGELEQDPSYRNHVAKRPSKFAEEESLDAALAAADARGPLVQEARNGLPLLMALGMGLTDSPSGPRGLGDIAETVAATWKAARALPKQEPGPKAVAIASIVSTFIAAGRLDEAARAQAELEVEPRAVLQPLRDQTLLALSDAQRKAGRLRDALSSALRIGAASTRWKPLLELAGIPASCG